MTNPADRIVDLYQRRTREWDEARGRNLFERGWLDRFTALLPPGGSVLDIGCGSGEPIARHLIGSQFAVTGVDSAPTMIDLCRSRFPSAAWLVADMRELTLERRFDGLLSMQKRIALAANLPYEGQTCEVLVEGPSKKDPTRLTGRTRTNKIINFPGDSGRIGALVPVRVTRAGLYALEGEVATTHIAMPLVGA